MGETFGLNRKERAKARLSVSHWDNWFYITRLANSLALQNHCLSKCYNPIYFTSYFIPVLYIAFIGSHLWVKKRCLMIWQTASNRCRLKRRKLHSEEIALCR